MPKRKKATALLLALVLTLALLPSAAFADDICFIALNDTLLELTNTPAFIGSTAYVPCRTFDSFHLYYTFFAEDNTAMIYTAEKQFYFELSSGNTYDSSNNFYSTQAILRNGQVYLPAKFICGQFGLTYSYISGVGHGNILRITNGGAVLSDDKFLSAASTLMDAYYNAYMGLTQPVPGGSTPGQDAEEPDRSDTQVLLSFAGMPDAAMLDTLDSYAVHACFFLTAEEIRLSPDTVRRLVGSGHAVGVCCGEAPEAEYAEAAALLFDAARVTPLLLAAGAEADAAACRDFADGAALVFPESDLDVSGEAVTAAAVTSRIEFAETRISVRLGCDPDTAEILPVILQYLRQNQFSIRAPRETDAA